MAEPARILVIEDEEPLRAALCDALRAEGFEVLEAADGERGLELALTEGPELVLLDLMLPGLDGFQVLKRLRADRLAVPVLILSARGEEWDRVQGFEVGADDYVTKPFSMRELLLRIHAHLRRGEGGAPGVERGGLVRFGAVVVDFAGYSLERAGVSIGLSRKELDLLRYFLDHEGQVLERARLLDDVWGRDEFPTQRTVDMHVLKLRRKIEPEPDRPRHLLTVHGVGYKFQARAEGEG
jgi:two-component system alkaline phosphatase synthesis response regulator PhoP